MVQLNGWMENFILESISSESKINPAFKICIYTQIPMTATFHNISLGAEFLTVSVFTTKEAKLSADIM